jgi:hypothetical protein
MRRRHQLDSTPFTSEKLREGLWESKLLRYREQLPAAAEERLLRLLQVIRNRYRDDHSFEKANALRRRIREDLTGLQEHYVELKQELQTFLAAAQETLALNPANPDDTDMSAYQVTRDISTASAQVLIDQIAQIDQADSLLANLVDDAVLVERSNRAQKWQRYAPLIYGGVQEALGEQAPRGISDGGPIGRFFSWLVPQLTGEDTTAGSAGRQLRKIMEEARKAQKSSHRTNSKQI